MMNSKSFYKFQYIFSSQKYFNILSLCQLLLFKMLYITIAYLIMNTHQEQSRHIRNYQKVPKIKLGWFNFQYSGGYTRDNYSWRKRGQAVNQLNSSIMIGNSIQQQMLILLVIDSIVSTVLGCSTGQYYERGSESCLNCLSNCISCINSTSCSKCSSNYYINGNRCSICGSSSCSCNGLTLNCNNSSNMTQMFLIVVVPICATIIIVILGCLISKKCRTEPPPTIQQSSNQQFFMKVQPKLNNLGILSIVMKNKWVQNTSEDIIDEKSICVICLGDHCQILTVCKHTYHIKCLALWIKQQCKCPVCKRKDLSSVRKFCMTCHKNYIDIPLKQLKQFTSQLFNICNNCKASKNRRLDSLCQMDLNQTQ